MMMAMDPRNQHHDASFRPLTGPGPLVESMTLQDRPRFTRRGNPIVAPDPGSGASRFLALVLAFLFAAIVIGWQNSPESFKRRVMQAPPVTPAVEQADQPAPGGMTDLFSRFYLRLAPVMAPSAAADPEAGKMVIDQLEQFGATEADRVRAIIVGAEFIPVEDTLVRLSTMQAELDAALATPVDPADITRPDQTPESIALERRLASEELAILRVLYAEGPENLTDAQTKRLTDRYGKVGAYALTRGQPDRARQAVFGGPWPMMLLILAVFALVGLAFLTGCVLLVLGIVRYSSPRWVNHGQRPLPGGSVMLETYAVFVAGFAIMAIGSAYAEYHLTGRALEIAGMIQLPMQWLLMFAVLWPLFRGMPASSWRQAMGLHRGEGFFREVGCGIMVYLASVPVYFFGVLATFVAMIVWEAVRGPLFNLTDPPPPPSNPVFELLGQGNLVLVLLIFTLATIWAPITEELIFRGALFRHIRGRGHWVIAGLLSATLFAYMHSYGPLMVGPLIALGFMFAFMREWRGSIIAPMTAHFLHNFTMLTIALTVLSLID